MDYQELKKQTVSQLRELAKDHEDIKGVSSMKKQELVDALAAKLGVGTSAGAVPPADKGAIKTQIRVAKRARDEAIAAKDRGKMKETRQQLHRLRRQLKRAVRTAAGAEKSA